MTAFIESKGPGNIYHRVVTNKSVLRFKKNSRPIQLSYEKSQCSLQINLPNKEFVS